jgi:DNA-binding NtrC family response regulator
MQQLYSELERVVASDAPVLITGPTGSGKELVADAIVGEGPRRDRPLVVVDCAALSPDLAAPELFGHVKGAFTGAVSDAPGAFERAHGGTIFLDEVGELPLEVQAQLLGLLERRTLRRIGGDRPISVDVRVLSSTQSELEMEVNRGTFRSDLYYRLAALQVGVPALREHPEDIPILVEHFLKQIPGSKPLSPSALRQLYEHEYPGNVRQLRNAVERSAAGMALEARSAAAGASPGIDVDVPYHTQKHRVLTDFQRSYVTELLRKSEGNLSEAARRGGLDRTHLCSLVRLLGLTPTRG